MDRGFPPPYPIILPEKREIPYQNIPLQNSITQKPRSNPGQNLLYMTKQIFPNFPYQESQYSVKTQIRFFPPDVHPPKDINVLLYLFDEDGRYAIRKAIFDGSWIFDSHYVVGMISACWTFIPRPPEKFNPHQKIKK